MPNRPVSEVVGQRSFATAGAATTVRAIAKIMRESHSSAVLIVEEGVLAGICTERDIVFGAVAADRDLENTRVDAIMKRNLQTIGPEKPFGHALHHMYEGGFRHIPVVDHTGRLLGVVAAHDALSIEALRFLQELVRREEITEAL
jgi:CBS domain-containing protein